MSLQKQMEIPVHDCVVGEIIQRSDWTYIKPKEVHAALTLPLKGVIVHHTGIKDHQCDRPGEIFVF